MAGAGKTATKPLNSPQIPSSATSALHQKKGISRSFPFGVGGARGILWTQRVPNMNAMRG